MRPAVSLGVVFLVSSISGCAVPLGANISDVERGPAIGGGSCAVAPAPVSAAKPKLESGGYSVDLASWNEEFAGELTTQLKDAGVQVGEGDPLEIGVVGFHYRNNPDTWAMEATFEIQVKYGAYTARHKGFFSDDSVTSSSTQAAWKAAGVALSTLLKDPDFSAALTGS